MCVIRFPLHGLWTFRWSFYVMNFRDNSCYHWLQPSSHSFVHFLESCCNLLYELVVVDFTDPLKVLNRRCMGVAVLFCSGKVAPLSHEAQRGP